MMLTRIDPETLLRWLEQLSLEHYLCGDCQGIHISSLQAIEGVMESRLFLEQDCLIFSTELLVPSRTILPLQAELARINAGYAHIKAFLDFADEGAGQRLILCDTLWTGAGLAPEQIDLFLQAAIAAKTEIVTELVAHHLIDCAESEMEAEPFPVNQLH